MRYNHWRCCILATPPSIGPAIWFKKHRDRLLQFIPVPNINPNSVSFFTVYLSIASLIALRYSRQWFFILYMLALLLDGTDGMIARRYGRESEVGYQCDAISDRLCEGIVFLHFGWFWFATFIFNTALSVWSVAKNKHRVLPMRFFFLVWYPIAFFL